MTTQTLTTPNDDYAAQCLANLRGVVAVQLHDAVVVFVESESPR